MRKRNILTMFSIISLLICASSCLSENKVLNIHTPSVKHSSSQTYSQEKTMGTSQLAKDKAKGKSKTPAVTTTHTEATEDESQTLVTTPNTTLITAEITNETSEDITTIVTTTINATSSTVVTEVFISENSNQTDSSNQNLCAESTTIITSEAENQNDRTENIQTPQNVQETESIPENEYTEYEINEPEQYQEDYWYFEEEEQQYYSDCVIISGNVIPVFCGPASQENVDEYDVVQDTQYFCDTNKIMLFGHFYKSFQILDSVAVGDEITLINSDYETHYYVTRSEIALYEDENWDFRFPSDGKAVIKCNYYEPTIILVTCKPEYGYEYRWIVTAVAF